MGTGENTKEKKEKSIILTTIILILLIIILFLLIRHLGKINHTSKMPTGNVDIFDVIFQNVIYCTCDKSLTVENKEDTLLTGKNNVCSICGKEMHLGTHTNTNNNINDGGSTDVNEISDILVYDDNTLYSTDTKLDIFNHASYHVLDGKIAPESENSYQFIIRNNNSFGIRYNFETVEENKYNINMQYRLKCNGEYVLGNDNEYVTVDKLNQYDVVLADKTYNVYTLDWKWVESNNDTKIGTTIDANYKLALKLSASQY